MEIEPPAWALAQVGVDASHDGQQQPREENETPTRFEKVEYPPAPPGAFI